MLKEPLGMVLLLGFAVYWYLVIFGRNDSSPPECGSKEVGPSGEAQSPGGPDPHQSAIASFIGFVIASVLSAGLVWELIGNFEKNPLGVSVVLSAGAFLAFLLLFRPRHFAQVVVVGFLLFGAGSLLGTCESGRGPPELYYRK